MKFILVNDYDEMSRKAAEYVSDQVRQKPQSILGLATGSTPEGLYALLAQSCQEEALDFSQVTTYNLDEYRGLSADHPQSYHYFMQEHLFEKININTENTHVLDGSNPDADTVCAAFEKAIDASGGLDLQLLGLGHNGHIGFNEPSEVFPKATHCVSLTDSTIQANSRLFDSIEEVPLQAYTMGIGTIMKARSILVVVSGSDKAQTVYDAFFGPVSPQVPASILQLHHNIQVIVDKEAGALCPQ